MEINYRGILWCVIIAAMAIAMMCVIHANAEPNGTGSYMIVETLSPEISTAVDTAPLPVYSISQGDEVYLNDTVDISRVTGWPGPDGDYRIAWYGRYTTAISPDELEPEYIMRLPGKSRSGTVPTQYRFYFDPAVFSERTGWWYQFYSNTTVKNEGAGNLRAFHINYSYRSITSGNETRIQYNSGKYQTKKIPDPLMPEKRISDILVARGDAPDMTVAGNRVWIFGAKYGLFNIERNITREDIWGLEPGTYNVVYQNPGANTIYDVTLSGDYLIPGLYGKKPVDISSAKKDAYVMQEKFTSMVKDSDDIIASSKMEVQEPYVTLDRIDEIYLNGITVLDIRGYTNAANGTKITVTLDEGRSYKAYIPERTTTTDAVRTNPGYLSYYRAYLPVDYDTLEAANAVNHTVTVKTAIGGIVYKDFWLSVLPADSYKPNAAIKYIEDRNPWQPTPTPEIRIQKEQVIVTQTVPVQIPPSEQQVKEAAEKIIAEQNQRTIGVAVIISVACIVLAFIVWFGFSVYRARRASREMKK